MDENANHFKLLRSQLLCIRGSRSADNLFTESDAVNLIRDAESTVRSAGLDPGIFDVDKCLDYISQLRQKT